MNELVRYLIANLVLDFQGDITVEKIRGFLREDESKQARRLLSKIIEERGADDLLLALADVLKDDIEAGVTPEKVREQLSLYSDA